MRLTLGKYLSIFQLGISSSSALCLVGRGGSGGVLRDFSIILCAWESGYEAKGRGTCYAMF